MQGKDLAGKNCGQKTCDIHSGTLVAQHHPDRAAARYQDWYRHSAYENKKLEKIQALMIVTENGRLKSQAVVTWLCSAQQFSL